jgi:hypothetical protein
MTFTFSRFDRFTPQHPYVVAGSADELIALAKRGGIPKTWRFHGAPEAVRTISSRRRPTGSFSARQPLTQRIRCAGRDLASGRYRGA